MAQVQYWIEVQNDYLGKYRRITGRTRREVEIKASEQLQRWSEQEWRARERDRVANSKEAALAATDEAEAVLEAHRGILKATLTVDDRLDWMGMMDASVYRSPEPSLAEIRIELDVPAPRPFLERLRLASRDKRLRLEAAATELYERAVAEHQAGTRLHQERQAQRNREVDAFRAAYEHGEQDAVERYVSLVLAASAFPDGFERTCQVGYDVAERMLVVDVELPSPDQVPSTVAYRYVASRDAVEEKRLKDKEIAELYDDVVVQAILRTMHEVFEGDYAGHCELVVVNGVVDGVDRATGKDFRAYIASCQAEREAFLDIDLARVDPRECFRGLRGLSGARLADLQPVRPVRVLKRDDPRFIEADGILDEIEAGRNLMTMEWKDFEILVRDLFNEMFADRGAEVKVTRSSRDEGVDGVILDPDPVLGGTTLVQAKRYRSTVPAAAVRELYGAVTNERASKGVLVTTSHFGKGAREFAKDKPLTLLDGANLLHFLQNHGHKVRIDLTEPSP